MKIKEIRNMGLEELKKKSLELAEELFRLRIRHSSGQLESPSSLGRTRRDIARIKTALKEKEAR
ncbi:MAG: 50S ribosomal protein L29 [Syntrophobacteraceae bacterium CG23_combo_of_CG06-09_8_20_14_all_50_8]|nr:MAG: 50S ribosomal protein L29 [Syntrophobacteraceae bacterium CG23_combo_of_CG06-09_8_20_14_all_50_8]